MTREVQLQVKLSAFNLPHSSIVRAFWWCIPMAGWIQAAIIAVITAGQDGEPVLSGTDGNALVGLFEALATEPDEAIRMDCPGYGALFDRFAAETPVRGPNRSHAASRDALRPDFRPGTDAAATISSSSHSPV